MENLQLAIEVVRQYLEHEFPGRDVADFRDKAYDGHTFRVDDETSTRVAGLTLPTAIVDELAPNPREVVGIDVGIVPGQRVPRGLATASAVLGYCGRPIPSLSRGEPVYGWGDLDRHMYPDPVGERWLSNVDVPERSLWPSRYPALRSIRLAAGLELSVLHLTLSAAARLVRLGVIRSLVPRARFMMRIADAFDAWASDAGAMHVRVDGVDQQEQHLRRTWTLVAERGDGPQIPATPAALLVKKLLEVPGYAPLHARGAAPCIGLLTLGEIIGELAGYAIRTRLDQEQLAVAR